MPNSIPHTVRELRTSDAWPSAPRPELLFSREALPPKRVIVVWDISRSGHELNLARMATDAQHAPPARLDEVRLFRTDDAAPLAVIKYTVVAADLGDSPSDNSQNDSPSDSTGLIGLLQVHAAVADAQATHIALTLLAQADHALLLTDETRGDAVMRKLLRAPWPKGLRSRIIETPAPDAALSPWPWLQNLIHPPAQANAAPTTPVAPAPAGNASIPDNDAPNTAPENPVTRHKAPRNSAESTNAHSGKTGTAQGSGSDSPRPGTETCQQALTVVAMAPGVTVAAVLDCRDGSLLAHHGALPLTQLCAHAATQLWNAYSALPGTETLHELDWASGQRHHLLLPIRNHPGLVLLVAVDREFGDLAAARWQLAVARNNFL